jgi:2-C-methyl-D-erythritol 2,4-cyclodiphosphate synthase
MVGIEFFNQIVLKFVKHKKSHDQNKGKFMQKDESLSRPIVRCGLGQDSHRFLPDDSSKPLVIAGVIFDEHPGFKANSDGDVVYHAICNAITSLSGIKILGGIADDLCLKDGITDSSVYLQSALETLQLQTISHIAITLEGKRPNFSKKIPQMRANIAKICGINLNQVGITATSGEGLTDFGCGEGVQAFCIITTMEG